MRLPRPWMRGLIPYSMTREAQLVMRQLVKHKKRTSVGRALLIISVALLTLPAYGSGADSSAVASGGQRSFTLRIGMTAPSGASARQRRLMTTPLGGPTSDRACPVASCRR
jgi:hypothetical protein